MIVQKFGGTSVGGAEPIRRLSKIVERALARQPVVVVSAVGGVTNRLFKLTELALARSDKNTELALARSDWESELAALEELHARIIQELGLERALVAELFSELRGLVNGIALIRECTPRTQDYVASFGERICARIVAAQLQHAGIKAQAYDAWEVGLATDNHFGSARPLAECESNIQFALTGLAHVPVITGYIGKDLAGNITTLGRGGSDYSAAIFGAALNAVEIQIWTDVDGVMTADPRIVKHARHIDTLSFAEAAELAFFGAKVLHPATMVPAIAKNIPIRVLNSYRPEFEGTTVVGKLAPDKRGVKSIASKDRIVVVNVVAATMMFQYGFLERIAEVFARHEIVIDMIATSEVSVALTTDPRPELAAMVSELSAFAEVTLVRDMSLVSVVGEELKDKIGFAAGCLATLGEIGVKVEMISYGATRNNLSIVVAHERMRDVVSALHDRLFPAR